MKVSAGRTLMLLENFFPQDTRVRNEANLLVSSGYEVSVICLRKPGQDASEIVEGVRVYRVPRFELFQKTPAANPTLIEQILLKTRSLIGYIAEYAYFTSACFLVSIYIFLKHGFDVIHAHNPPDTLFVVALPFKLLNKKFIFDHHDLCPELYRSRYGSAEGFLSRMLRITEWFSLKLANVTIATNESYKAAHIERAQKPPDSIFVVRNGPAEGRMKVVPPDPRLRAMNKAILCYI